jgi:UTP-glucose-1-phosphate uridylyltransferase
MLGVEVPREDVGRYGVLELNEKDEFVRIVEKPSAEQAPSTLINISKYVLDSEALECVRRYVAADRTGEYLITDPLNDYVTGGGSIKVVKVSGKYLDGGTVEGWLDANRAVLES